MTKVLKQRLLMRVLCLLLSLFLIIMPILIPAAEAIFIESAATAYVYELIATALVAGGFVVANSDDLISVSVAVYNWAKEKTDPLCDTLMGIARQALNFAGDITKTAWRMSTEAWDAICDAVSGVFSSGSTVLPVEFSTTVHQFFSNSKLDEVFHSGVPGLKTVSTAITVNKHLFTCELVGSYCVVYRDGVQIHDFSSQGGLFGFSMLWVSERYYQIVFSTYKPDLSYNTGGGVAFGLEKLDQYDVVVHNLISSSALPAPDLTYPGDGTMVLAPPLPTTAADPDDGTETVIIPPISTYPDDWTMDFPKTDTGEQVDVPTDTLVDAGTGTKVDVNNPDIPDNPSGTVDWPSTSDLSIPELIVSKFPFCIPFDVARMIGVLQADPVAPVFRFPLKYGAILDEEIVLDLSRWDDVVRIIRWGELICFVAGLAYVTKTYIKW